jgi:hypothetical protein
VVPKTISAVDVAGYGFPLEPSHVTVTVELLLTIVFGADVTQGAAAENAARENVNIKASNIFFMNSSRLL